MSQPADQPTLNLPLTPFESATIRKVIWRLMPLLLLSYIANVLDRGNVAFTKLTMQKDLDMSDSAYMFGTGMFYFGYLLFEVPSNLIMRRTGARIWIARIMLSWGLVSALTMYVTGIWSFLSVRVLLGIAEAGFFPGVIYYLTYWVPMRERTRAVAKFMAANALASIFMNPLSGWIMEYLDGYGALKGWQWVFLIEAVPSLILGVCVYWLLTDRPAEAGWLNDQERNWLVDRLQQEEQRREQRHGSNLWAAFFSGRVWYLILLYFTVAFCANAGGGYLPELIKLNFPEANKFRIGLLAAIPSICGATGMLLNGHFADATRRYRLHVAFPALISASGWLLAAFAPTPIHALVGLSLAVMGINSMLPAFWSLPASFLSGAAAAGGIALINSVGNIGGLLGPWFLGIIKDKTNSHFVGMQVLAAVLVLGCGLALFAPHDREST